jgi:hypothetical protein
MVSALAQSLGNGYTSIIEVSLIRRQAPVPDHISDTGLVRIQTRQQSCSGRTAAGGIVELRETKTFRGQAIQIRGPDLRSVTAQIGKTEIVRHNQDDVRAARRVRLKGMCSDGHDGHDWQDSSAPDEACSQTSI